MSGGSGYDPATVHVNITGPTSPPNSGLTAGLGQQASADAVVNPVTGAITGFTNIVGGYGYSPSSPPTITVTGGGGSGFHMGAVGYNLGLGFNSTYTLPETYASHVTQLYAQPPDPTDNRVIALANLPAGNSYPAPLGGPAGGNMLSVWPPLARALGNLNASNANIPMDAVLALNTAELNLTRPGASGTNYDALAVTLHELVEVLAGGSAMNGQRNAPTAAPPAIQPIDPLDRYRFAPPTVNAMGQRVAGVRSYNLFVNTNAEFSINGRVDDLARFNQVGGGEYSDWFSPHTAAGQPLSPAPVRVQDAYQTPNQYQPQGFPTDFSVELTRLDVLGYTLAANTPDLTLTITDSEGGTIALGNDWVWTLHVANTGGQPANFGNLQRIVVDNLPGVNISYSGVLITNEDHVTGMLASSMTANVLTISANGNVSIANGGSFDIIFSATPSAAGTFSNPAVPGVAVVDPDRWIPDNKRTNNSASDAVVVTQTRYVTFTTDPNIDDAEADNFSVSGTGIKDGDTITLRINDADGPPYDYTATQTVTVTGGMWTVSGIDASILNDGEVTYIASEMDPKGFFTSAFASANKSTAPAVGPTVAMTAPADHSFTNNNMPTLSAIATDNSGSGLASVQLEYSSDGGTTWKNAGGTMSTAPFTFTFTTALDDGD